MNTVSDTDEILLRPYPIRNSNFVVIFDDFIVACSKVKSFQTELELEQVQEGGYNIGVHSLAKPTSNPNKLVLERAVTDKFGENFVFTSIGRAVGEFLVLVYDHNHKPAFGYNFYNGVISKLEYGDLDALQGQIFYNTIEITYDRCTLVDLDK